MNKRKVKWMATAMLRSQSRGGSREGRRRQRGILPFAILRCKDFSIMTDFFKKLSHIHNTN